MVNDGGRLLDLICCSKFLWTRERISPKIIRDFDMRSQNVFQPSPK